MLDVAGISLSLLRALVCVAVLVTCDHVLVQAAASAGVFFALFTLLHDAMHGALGLDRRANARLLSTLGLLLLGSGHAMRRMHLVHHARPLSAIDIEGAGAAMPWWRAVARGPWTFFSLRSTALRRAPARERRVQRGENAVATTVTIALVVQRAVPGLAVYVATVTAIWMLAPFWAAHVPHNAPRWLTHAARRLSFLRSPVLSSLAHHDTHHAHPKVPCHRLALSAS